MANAFKVEKTKRTSSRKLPFLPRIGLIVDLGGSKFSFLHSPLLETFLNWRERGFSLKNLMDTANDEMSEIVRHFRESPFAEAPEDLRASKVTAEAARDANVQEKAGNLVPKKQKPSTRSKPAAEKKPVRKVPTNKKTAKRPRSTGRTSTKRSK